MKEGATDIVAWRLAQMDEEADMAALQAERDYWRESARRWYRHYCQLLEMGVNGDGRPGALSADDE